MSQQEQVPGQADSVSLDDQERVAEVLRESILGLWDVVNTLTRLRPTKRERYRVTIFGSARAESGMPAYEEVRTLARHLAEMGCDIITGGGPGLMQAANEGSAAAGDLSRSVGIRIDLQFEQAANPFVGQVYRHKTFFTRLHQFVLDSDAFVVVPGGIGTLLETAMIWQLLQVRKIYGAPFILVGQMWTELVHWAQTYMMGIEPRLAEPIDMMIPSCVQSVEEAVQIIRRSRESWLQQRPGK